MNMQGRTGNALSGKQTASHSFFVGTTCEPEERMSETLRGSYDHNNSRAASRNIEQRCIYVPTTLLPLYGPAIAFCETVHLLTHATFLALRSALC